MSAEISASAKKDATYRASRDPQTLHTSYILDAVSRRFVMFNRNIVRFDVKTTEMGGFSGKPMSAKEPAHVHGIQHSRACLMDVSHFQELFIASG